MIEINTNRLTIDELKEKLKAYDIDVEDINNRVVLAEILQNRLNDETSKQNTSEYIFFDIKSHNNSKTYHFFSSYKIFRIPKWILIQRKF